MITTPLQDLREAEQLLISQEQEARAGDWSNIQAVDKACRTLVDRALDRYDELSSDDQQLFRQLGGEVLQRHRALLEFAESELEAARKGVGELLKSDKMRRAYGE